MNNFGQIFAKIKKHFNVNSEKELCEKLDINYNTYYTWYKRNSIPWDLLALICEKEKLSMDELVFNYQNLDLSKRLILEKMDNLSNDENLCLLQNILDQSLTADVKSIINPGSPPWKNCDIVSNLQSLHLVKCVGDNILTMFGLLVFCDGSSIYLAEGRMNFQNGGHSGLKPLRSWLIDCNAWDDIDKKLHFIDHQYFVDRIAPAINFSAPFRLNLTFCDMPNSEKETFDYFNLYIKNQDW